ncbi:MAG TPA: TM2 domain-containing protein [bacterium]|nr:TM2 domain-containing protein [bacterium]
MILFISFISILYLHRLFFVFDYWLMYYINQDINAILIIMALWWLYDLSNLNLNNLKKTTSIEINNTYKKQHFTTFLLSFLYGIFGIDRFYLGYTELGFFKLMISVCFFILLILNLTDKVENSYYLYFGILYIIDVLLIYVNKLKDSKGNILV